MAITYLIDAGLYAPRKVDGFAFEIDGWTEFHCCVRFGNRYGDDFMARWVIDHYETGLAISDAGVLNRKEDAAAAMKKFLDSKGKALVHQKMASWLT